MPRTDDLHTLPEDLPIPVDDGACDHLQSMHLPAVPLRSTAGELVDLAALPGGTVVYCYPRTGEPNVEVPPGWNEIPGARGCTPQSCAYRDQYQELLALGAGVYGLSTQTTDYQREAATRLHLPFSLLSDADLRFTSALRLPTFEFTGMTLVRRLTMIIREGQIETVFYPVFPSDQDAPRVVAWLTAHPRG